MLVSIKLDILVTFNVVLIPMHCYELPWVLCIVYIHFHARNTMLGLFVVKVCYWLLLFFIEHGLLQVLLLDFCY